MKLDNILGSRNSDGNVPNVNWNGDNRKLHVNWYNVDNRNDNLRARAEVSGEGLSHEGSFLFVYASHPLHIFDTSMTLS